MKSRTFRTALSAVLVTFFFAATAMPMAAQDHKVKHHKYRLVDLGTFGGPASFFNTSVNGSLGLNSRGIAVGTSATSISSDKKSSGWVCGGANGLLPFVFHAFEFKDDVLKDLGGLAGEKRCNNPLSLNTSGDIVGASEINRIDRSFNVREVRAVLWRGGKIKSLGTFGGAHSSASSINNHGQIVGIALNRIPDPFSLFFFGNPNGTQTRAFLWEHGAKHDLLTLGGPDSWAQYINERGQVGGWSYTSDVPDSNSGIPPLHPFVWSKSKGMVDLGGFGGTFGFPTRLNSRGQLSGYSNLAGDLKFHPFFWDGKKLQDLGTFGGNTGIAECLNDAGEVVGVADFPRNLVHDAFLWKKGSKLIDLGNLGRTSLALWINSKGQIVGNSRINDAGEIRGFLWEKGGPMVDLNALIPPHSPLLLVLRCQSHS